MKTATTFKAGDRVEFTDASYGVKRVWSAVVLATGARGVRVALGLCASYRGGVQVGRADGRGKPMWIAADHLTAAK